ncbi:hypothetical protein BD626DRAFT_67423 [Schizophyllum amplum]|uniref:Glycoside hydrolase 131 catalytic N-terminal domain-containing protein n=1 Tax=Schizophyllum amplum TaxID=97359 RepID=A0A550CBC5_9AGAR|nr:hypothetical protein BD626DRAFT_67423 [Auriculariopsis ampla]
MLLYRVLPVFIVIPASLSAILYEGRVPSGSLDPASLDSSADPFLTAVRGSEDASYYTSAVTDAIAPTPLWDVDEETISVMIDNSSVFLPGGSNPQNGFRRTELIAEQDGSATTLYSLMEIGTTAFHFSIMADTDKPLNYDHEYQIVFIEPSDGTHVFGIVLGTPFNTDASDEEAHSIRVLAHDSSILFETTFTESVWHNFAVLVDWSALTLQAYYSVDADDLAEVSDVIPNTGVSSGSAGQGDFHFGVLKVRRPNSRVIRPLINDEQLPLPDPSDPSHQSDVVHYGIQEGTTEGLFYSGVFVEDLEDGLTTS